MTPYIHNNPNISLRIQDTKSEIMLTVLLSQRPVAFMKKGRLLFALMAFSMILNFMVWMGHHEIRPRSFRRHFRVDGPPIAGFSSTPRIKKHVENVQIGTRDPFVASDRVLVTGAAGFIGMHTCLRLVQSPDGAGLDPTHVIGIDHFDDTYSVDLKRARHAELQRAGITVVNASVCDAQSLRHLFETHNFTHVIHLAARPAAGASHRRRHADPPMTTTSADCFDVLSESIVRLLPYAHLVYASSGAVYAAESAAAPTAASEGDAADAPASLDGAAKRSNELLAAAHYLRSGLHSTGLRLFRVYGEWGRPDTPPSTWAAAIAAGRPVAVSRRGGLRRDLTYIDDAVDGVLRACEHRAPAGGGGGAGVPWAGRPAPEIFNLGGGGAVEEWRLLRLLERHLNSSSSAVVAAAAGGDGGAGWEDAGAGVADVRKARWVLGWRPRTGVEEGVRRFAAWYRERAAAWPEFHAVGAGHGDGGAGSGASESFKLSASGTESMDSEMVSDVELPRLEEEFGGGDGSGGKAEAPPSDASPAAAPPEPPSAAAIRVAVARRAPHERLARPIPPFSPSAPRRRAPVVAVVTRSTSRGMGPVASLAEHPLWTRLLDSALATAEDGFEYWFYIGYDAGDPLFEDSDNRAGLQAAFARRAEGLRGGVVARLALVRVANPWGKPGPVFNVVSAAAHADGADYIYRVNDDVVFETPWARPMTAALAAFAPANLGVIGPTCRQGNVVVLVSDFTHRTHLEIFGGLHYPSELTDWWLDDWITAVYPRPNTLRLPHVTIGHMGPGGTGNLTRYAVDKSRAVLLGPAVRRGRAAVAAHLGRRLEDECAAMAHGAHNFSAIHEVAAAAFLHAAEGDFPPPPPRAPTASR